MPRSANADATETALNEIRDAAQNDYDRFLLEEGLELLAEFRRIKDPKCRREILNRTRAAANEG